MNYQYPDLWNRVVSQGWATPETCSPAEFYQCVARSERNRKGKGKVNSYAKKAFKKMEKEKLYSKSVIDLQSKLKVVVDANRSRLAIEQAKRAEAERIRQIKDAEIASLRKQLNATQTSLQQTQAKLTICNASLAEFRTRVVNLTAELARGRDAARTLEQRVDQLARNLENAQERVTEIAAAFRQARQEASESRGRVTQIERTLATVNDNIARLLVESAAQTNMIQQLSTTHQRVTNLLANLR